MSRGRGLIAGVSLALALTIGGCASGSTTTATGESSQQIPSSPVEPPSPSVDLTPTPDPPSPEPSSSVPSPDIQPLEKPEWPEAANTHDEAGALAFAKYYLQLMKWSANSGDTAEVASMTLPSCEPCSTYLNRIAERQELGGYFAGGGFTFDGSTDSVEKKSDSSYFITFIATEAPAETQDDASSPVRQIDQATFEYYLALAHSGELWQVIDLGATPQ